MKKYLHAYAMCQSMFCAIPCPFKVWDEKARSCMLLFLPVIGLEIGALWVGLKWLLGFLQVPYLVLALVLCAFPYLVTGFMHLDGFMDVTDAVCSWRDLNRRREILKDSHVGSFAVVWCVFLLLGSFAFWASVPEEADYFCMILVPVVSRCCSAMAVLKLKPMSTSQYAEKEKAAGWHLAVLAAAVLLCVLIGFLCFGKYGFVLIGTLFGYAFALRRSYKSLEGMNGDISGYCLTISELCAVAVLALL
ncbi:MAG: adenosylcobinamide-GDP ribazoletransferase [Lachnospiraceae bacterium]|nr:adenosylcobinamide-GDP ribazoletransferase [Lachnospiraceae bacterium]